MNIKLASSIEKKILKKIDLFIKMLHESMNFWKTFGKKKNSDIIVMIVICICFSSLRSNSVKCLSCTRRSSAQTERGAHVSFAQYQARARQQCETPQAELNSCEHQFHLHTPPT